MQPNSTPATLPAATGLPARQEMALRPGDISPGLLSSPLRGTGASLSTTTEYASEAQGFVFEQSPVGVALRTPAGLGFPPGAVPQMFGRVASPPGSPAGTPGWLGSPSGDAAIRSASPSSHDVGGFVAITPEATRYSLTTPPQGLAAPSHNVEQEIEAALQEDSVALLRLALTCKRRCSRPHCVHEAVRRGHVRALRLLLESGAEDVDVHCYGLRPLHLVLQKSSVEDDNLHMLHLLLEHGAKPNFCKGDVVYSNSEEAPLHDVVRRGCVSFIAVLLEHGADANARDRTGNTPLHALCQQTCPWTRCFNGAVISLLLSAGAVPSTTNDEGKSPLQGAATTRLRAQIFNAERWFGRRAFLLAQGGTQRSTGPFAALLLEVLDRIAAFL